MNVSDLCPGSHRYEPEENNFQKFPITRTLKYIIILLTYYFVLLSVVWTCALGSTISFSIYVMPLWFGSSRERCIKASIDVALPSFFSLPQFTAKVVRLAERKEERRASQLLRLGAG